VLEKERVMGKLKSFRDLKVYQKLKALHLVREFSSSPLGGEDRGEGGQRVGIERLRSSMTQEQPLTLTLSPKGRGSWMSGALLQQDIVGDQATYGSATAQPTWPEVAEVTTQHDEAFSWTP
jgi:hypothetical protein